MPPPRSQPAAYRTAAEVEKRQLRDRKAGYCPAGLGPAALTQAPQEQSERRYKFGEVGIGRKSQRRTGRESGW